MNQHLVSRVLLRRWADRPRGPVRTLNVDTLEQRTDDVDSLGSMRNLTTVGTAELEQGWSRTVESTLPHAFSLIDGQRILEPRNRAHLEHIKDCIALHWARGFAIIAILQSLQPDAENMVVEGVLERFTATQAVEALNGQHIEGPEAERVFRKLVHQEFEARKHREFLRDQFIYHYDEAQRRMEGLSLEICHASASEFVIADCPVVTWNKDLDAAGVLFGAKWGESDVLFMAVGPKHVVALSREGHYRELNEGEVVKINKLQVRAARQEIYFRPGCNLGDRIAEALMQSRPDSRLS